MRRHFKSCISSPSVFFLFQRSFDKLHQDSRWQNWHQGLTKFNQCLNPTNPRDYWCQILILNIHKWWKFSIIGGWRGLESCQSTRKIAMLKLFAIKAFFSWQTFLITTEINSTSSIGNKNYNHNLLRRKVSVMAPNALQPAHLLD